jgi:hypothetical protein
VKTGRVIIGIALLAVVIGTLTFWRFSSHVSLPNPVSIQLVVFDRETKSTNVLITTNATPIVAALRHGKPVEVHACKGRAHLLFNYADGTTRRIEIQPGHKTNAYEFYVNKLYAVPRTELFSALRAAGIPPETLPLESYE